MKKTNIISTALFTLLIAAQPALAHTGHNHSDGLHQKIAVIVISISVLIIVIITKVISNAVKSKKVR